MAHSARRFDSPWYTAAVTGVLALVFVLARLAALDWDVERLVTAGERFTSSSSGLPVEPGTGFDGQFFYRLALDPFTSQRSGGGVELDIPALRQQRILYPTLAWAASGGGRPSAVPSALLGLNVAGLVLVGLLGGALAQSAGRHALWGLALSLYPGFAVTLGLDLAEIVAAAFVLGSLLALRRGRPGVCGASLALAVLARETTLVVVAGMLVVWGVSLARRRAPSVPLVAFAPAVGVYAAVQAWLWASWGSPPLASGGAVNIGVPFRKLASEVAAWGDQGGAFAAYHWVLLLALAAFVGLVSLSLRLSGAPAHEKAGFALAALLVPFLAGTIWLHYWASLRALTELYLLGGLVLLSRPLWRIDRLGVAVAALWVSVSLNMSVAAARLAPPG